MLRIIAACAVMAVAEILLDATLPVGMERFWVIYLSVSLGVLWAYLVFDSAWEKFRGG